MAEEQRQAPSPSDPSPPPAPAPGRWFVLLSLLGLGFSAYLEKTHVETYLRPSKDAFCSVGEKLDCLAVAASSESVFLGLPWALWGIVGFYALLAASVRRSQWLLPLAAGAALASLALFVVSYLRVGSFCMMCEAVHVISFALFGLALTRRRLLTESWRSLPGISQVLGSSALLALALFFVVPKYWAAFSYRGEPTLPTGKTANGHHWIGSRNPTLTVHELTDYDCPHCKAASIHSLRRVAEHPHLRLIRRQNSRRNCSPRVENCKKPRAALCAGEQGRFWQADRWLFAQAGAQQKLDLDQLAADVKLDADALGACMDRPETYERARAGFELAHEHHFSVTPSYFVVDTGKMMTSEKFWDFVNQKLD